MTKMEKNTRILMNEKCWKTGKIKVIHNYREDWLDFFFSPRNILHFNSYIAYDEFKEKINEGWKKAIVANYISLKKWLAEANGNISYSARFNPYAYSESINFPNSACGYCFLFWSYDDNGECNSNNCLYKKIYPRIGKNIGKYGCSVTEPEEMIKRFQKPKLLKLIKEAGKNK